MKQCLSVPLLEIRFKNRHILIIGHIELYHTSRQIRKSDVVIDTCLCEHRSQREQYEQ